jgi:hypothetical protein
MCDLQLSNIKEAVRQIFEDEGFKSADTPQLSEQLRQLLLENGSRTDDEVDTILGCTTINIGGSRRDRVLKRRKSRSKTRVRRHARSTRHK